MSLARSIVIKNEFTVRDRTGEGSRGSTPGAYVERYMGRGEAIEPCLPVAMTSPDAYVMRYMARRDAVESVGSLTDAERKTSRVGEKDGVAFSGGSVSLSEDELRRASREIQRVFDAGQPVMKCVLSFDTDYLKSTGVVPKNVQVKRRGDLRGQVDQLRLRSSIMEGMAAVAHGFSQMLWVGVLQFDTRHVHAHLVIAEGDLSTDRRRRPDGQFRGMLSSREMGLLRGGIDRELDMTRRLPYLSADISNQRRNVRSFVKRYAADAFARSGELQLVLASLPADERVWRAATHRRDMRRADELARAFVRDVLSEPDSGYADVKRQIQAYADARVEREGAGARRREELVRHGLSRLEDECVNGVYAELARWRHRPVHTRPIDIMASDIAEAAQLSDESEADAMMFRLRTYGGRMLDARDRRAEAHRARRSWEEQHRFGQASEASRAAYEFYCVEEAYQTQVMCKYQGLFPLMLLDEDDDARLERLRRRRREVRGLEGLLMDDAVVGMTRGEAERYGRERYRVAGGGVLASAPQLFARRLELARGELDELYEETRFKLAETGRVLTMDDRGVRIMRGTLLSFDAVRGCDLHHLGYDFTEDREVGSVALGQFRSAYRERAAAVAGARDYFARSDNEFAIDELPLADVDAMAAQLARVERCGLIVSERHAVAPRTPIHTVHSMPEVAQTMRNRVIDELPELGGMVADDIFEGLI